METEANRHRFKDGLETQEVRERRPQDKGKWPLERDFGAQKDPSVTGGGVRTLGGQGTGSSRPALCVSRREWGTGRDRELGTLASSPATPHPARDAVTFLMSPRYREMRGGGEKGTQRDGPGREKVCQR